MGTPYPEQLAGKDAAVRRLLVAHAPEPVWRAPHPSPPAAFRNRAKLVVGGSRGSVTLGILDEQGRGVDLRHCGILQDDLQAIVPALAGVLDEVGFTPYDVPRRQGELKYVHLTRSPDGEVMARFVLRSEGQLGKLRRSLPELRAAVPGLRVVTANLHPTHSARLEGAEEIVLTPEASLPMTLGSVILDLPPRSFFQTNTAVATALYRAAAQWVSGNDLAQAWDLYCGVGGFALTLAHEGAVQHAVGVESSAEAIAGATASAQRLGAPARFVAADATRWARASQGCADLVVVNPPRRGIGPDLAGWLDACEARTVLYSSCDATSLAADLAMMPSWRVQRAQLFDMFPQTTHHEVLVLLSR